VPRSAVAGLLVLPLLWADPVAALQTTERTVRVRVSPASEPLPTETVFTKLDVGNVRSDTIPIGGVGGLVETPVRIAENVRLRLSDHIVEPGDGWTEQNGGADEVFFLPC
jgi:hypothetical protein